MQERHAAACDDTEMLYSMSPATFSADAVESHIIYLHVTQCDTYFIPVGGIWALP